MNKKARIYYDSTLAGYLQETDEGYEFYYEAAYLQDPSAKPVSLTLPLTAEKYTSKVLFAFFDGLIPEGWLLDIAKDHWKIRSNDRFQLLLITCSDAIGAVSVFPDEENQ